MKILQRVCALLIMLSLCLSFLASCGLEELVPDFLLPDEDDLYSVVQSTVKVSVIEGKGFDVTSENPIRVVRGEDITFDIEIDEGYEFDYCTKGAVYEDGKLTLCDVRYPTSIEFFVKKSKVPIIPGGPIVPDTPITPDPPSNPDDPDTPDTPDDPDDPDTPDTPSNPTTPDEPDDTRVDKDGNTICGETPIVPIIPDYDYVYLTPPTEDGFRFICWSVDGSIREGGKIIRHNAQDGENVYRIPKGKEPVANLLSNLKYAILYRTNGGTTKDGADYYFDTFPTEHYYMPNTLHQNGTFAREGYVLTHYTEFADGTGDYTTLGGKIETGEDGFIELYLNWSKVTTTGLAYSLFENDEGKNAACIEAYTGTDEEVTIPESITVSGTVLPVQKIAAGAFTGSSVRTLVIPHTMVTIEDEAFKDLTTLEKLVMHDNVWYVKDAAFSGCTSFKTLYLNSARLPVRNGDSLFCIKYEKIRRCAKEGKKMIVLISGSSSLHGLYAQQMEEDFLGEYAVVNYGTNASACALYYMEAFTRFFGEGDIIIHAPETVNANQMGTNNVTYQLFRALECMYETVSYVNIGNYNGFFDTLTDFNQNTRPTLTEKSYDYWSNFINEYTDRVNPKDNPTYVSQNTSYRPFSTANMTEERAARLNERYRAIKAQGAEMYFSFAPVNEDACKAVTLTKEEQDAYLLHLDTLLEYDVISNPADYLLDQSLIFDADYHPGKTGAIYRTSMLTHDIMVRLADEGKWQEDKVIEKPERRELP